MGYSVGGDRHRFDQGNLGRSIRTSEQERRSTSRNSRLSGKGGAPCKLEIAYDNECAAMVVGNNGYNVGADATVDKAVQLGMKICTDAKNTNCHVYYSACSLPQRIQ